MELFGNISSEDRNRESNRLSANRAYAANPEKFRERARLWRLKNPEKSKEVKRRSLEKNRESILRQQREYNKRRAGATKAYKLANKDKILAQERDRYEKNRDRIHARVNSNPNRKAVALASYHRNKEKNIINMRASKCASEAKRRVRINGGPSDPRVSLLYALLKLMPLTTCNYCGAFLPGAKAEVDHSIPLSRGGPHILENLRVACPTCNRSKKDKTPAEFELAKQQMKNYVRGSL